MNRSRLTLEPSLDSESANLKSICLFNCVIASNVFDKSHLNPSQKLIIRIFPNLFIEDFNLNRTGIPDSIYGLP